MNTFTYKVTRKIAVVENQIEFRTVSWNNGAEKYDLRKWYTTNGEERCMKGISFNKDEGSFITNAVNCLCNGDKNIFAKAQGRNELRVQFNKYGYDIGIWNGSYRMKGCTLTEKGVKVLRDVLNAEFGTAENKPKETKKEAPKQVEKPVQKTEVKPVEKAEEKPVLEFKKMTEHEKVVHALTSIPVNDGNYPVNTATKEQLEEAIRIMEASPSGQKTRLTRCKAKLKSLVNGTTRKSSSSKITPFAKKAEPVEEQMEDTTVSEEKVEYTDAVSKMEAELEKYTDPDSQYVIQGVIDACKADDEFAQKVLSTDKTYEGAFQYLYKKALAGNCIRINKNVGIMTKETALNFVLEYFRS